MTLVYLTLAWTAGLILGQGRTGNQPAVMLLFAIVSLSAAIFFRKRTASRLAFGLLALALMGMWRMDAAAAPPGPDTLQHYNGQGWREFTGVVTAEPDIRDQHVNLRVDVEQMRRFEIEAVVHGTALVQAPRYGGYAYGDRIQFSGTPLIPPEFDDFSYRDYLARKGVFTYVPNASVRILSRNQGNPLYSRMLALKRNAQGIIANALPEPQASLLTGILLGLETGISPEVREAFNATGASHVIAISGFNMTLIAGLLSRMLHILLPGRRRLTAVLSIASILIYAIFVGAGAAVLRAAVMSSLLVVAPLFHRKTYVPASLAFTALIMSLLDPYVLWDVGFQLSFAAVLGLALFTAPLENILRRWLSRAVNGDTAERAIRLLSEPLIVTLAAQITTTPLIAFHFGRVSLSALVVNGLILPVQTPLLILGGLATLVGLLTPVLAQPIFWLDWLFLSWTTLVVRHFAALPGTEISVRTDSTPVFAFYVALAAGMILQGTRPAWLRRIKSGDRLRQAVWLTRGAGAGVLILLLIAVRSQPDRQLHVHFLNSGHSNAVLIQTPEGAHILVDGGKYPTRLLTSLGDFLPFWDRDLELLILTQPKDAQFAAIPAVLERYHVHQVLTNGQSGDTESYAALRASLLDHGIPVQGVSAGYRIETADGVQIEVLYPYEQPASAGDPNDSGLVLRLTFGTATFLLTPDLSPKVEEALLADGRLLQAAVLQLPSHGAERVTSPAFLAAVTPQIAVVQVDAGNRYGHPAEEVLIRLGNVPLYRTDHHGTISFTTDGQTISVVTERRE